MEGGDLRMSSIDQRVVEMKFDSATFLSNAAASLKMLDSLNKALKMQGAAKGLSDISAAAGKQTSALQNIGSHVENIASKFRALSAIGFSALNTITSQAVFAGQQLVKSLTVQPIIDGFREYETNLNSIQTILSNTAAAGTNLKQVNAALNELNHYSDQTIYNFSEMAKNIGTFTAAGVGLKTATSAIKGIANLAALSGSNSQQASTAMYQLSQAISAGRVSLEDWNSVVNAGMGGTVFQRALAMNAEKMGTLSKGAVKLKGDMKNVTIEGKSFRESITAKPGEQSWLTSDVLTRTLSQFTGDLTDAQLAAQGFNKEQIKAIQQQAQMAKNAATQVKTFSQLANTLGESVGSGWAQTWQTIFGDFEEARTLFTNVNNVLGGFVQNSANMRNKVLADWKELGGRKAIIDAVSNSFKALVAFVKPIGQAFRQIFPATTGKQLADLSKQIRDFTSGLIIGGKTAENLRRTFAGVFAILGIGWDILKQVVKTLLSLAGVAFEGSGGFLEFTARIGDWLVGVRKAINDGGLLVNIFKGIGAILSVPIKAIKLLAGFLGSLFEGINGSGATAGIANVSKKLEPLGRLGEVIAKAWGVVLTVLDNVGKKFAQVGLWAQRTFGDIGAKISSFFEGLDFKDVLAGINTASFAALVLFIKQIIGSKLGGGGILGIFDNIAEAFESLTGALSAMQNTLRAATLLQIAAAVGILAISMNVLSKIDAAGLTRASAAISVMFTQLIASLLIFEKFSGFTGFAKMPFVATSMILLGAAINVLASAMVKMAALDWNGLAKGLTGTTLLLAALVGVGKLMPNPAGMISTGIGLVILAGAVKLLVSSVSDLAGFSWEELAKGLVGVGALLGALGLFTKFAAVSKGGALQGVGLVLLATGIKILASAMQDFAQFSWAEIGRGLVSMAGAIAIMTAALILIPPTAPLGAASILIVALSLGKVADALQQMAQMSWGDIGKSLVALLGALTIISLAVSVIPPNAPLGAAAILITALSLGMVADVLARLGAMDWGSIGKSLAALAGAMAIIAVGVNAMTGAVTGAAAVLIVAAALRIFVPVLQTLGAMSWGEIGKGLLTLAAAFAVLGVAGAVLAPVVPALIGLGIAVGLLGAGMALAGVGVLALSAGLAALAVSGAAGTAALVAMVSAILGLLPAVAAAIGKALVAFAQAISTAGPAMTKAMTVVIGSLIDAVVVLSPKIGNALYKLITIMLQLLAKYVPSMVSAGLKLVTGILQGIAGRIGGVVTAATSVVVAFINGVGNNLGRVIQAGVNLVLKFINGLASAIRSNSAAVGAAGANLGIAIVQGMARGLAGGIGVITAKAREIASSALSAAKSALGIHSPSKEFELIGKYVVEGFRKGLDGNKQDIDLVFNTLRGKLYQFQKDAADKAEALQKKLDKLRKARHKDTKAINSTASALAQARREQKLAASAWDEMRKRLTDEQSALGKLAGKYDQYTEKIKVAQQTLDDAIKTRDDYNKSITDQYGDIATPTADTKAADYIESLKKQVEDTKTFVNTIQRLRELGLNDEAYKDLLSAGISALPFAQDLLANGQAGIDQINSLNKELDGVAGQLGKTASSQLYQAAVDAAQGFVNGLKAQQAAIEKQMDAIADAMVKAIKKKLGIKSPSRVFAEIGGYSAEGMAEGLRTGSQLVEKSAANVGDNAIIALRKTLSGLRDQVGREMIDPMPTITPVLDLSRFRKDAGNLSNMLSDGHFLVGAAYVSAQHTAQAVRQGGSVSPADEAGAGGTVNNFTQNNYSPKALPASRIYRETNNLLSKAKKEAQP
jgi:tape measure domain-containing protein